MNFALFALTLIVTSSPTVSAGELPCEPHINDILYELQLPDLKEPGKYKFVPFDSHSILNHSGAVDSMPSDQQVETAQANYDKVCNATDNIKIQDLRDAKRLEQEHQEDRRENIRLMGNLHREMEARANCELQSNCSDEELDRIDTSVEKTQRALKELAPRITSADNANAALLEVTTAKLREQRRLCDRAYQEYLRLTMVQLRICATQDCAEIITGRYLTNVYKKENEPIITFQVKKGRVGGVYNNIVIDSPAGNIVLDGSTCQVTSMNCDAAEKEEMPGFGFCKDSHRNKSKFKSAVKSILPWIPNTPTGYRSRVMR